LHFSFCNSVLESLSGLYRSQGNGRLGRVSQETRCLETHPSIDLAVPIAFSQELSFYRLLAPVRLRSLKNSAFISFLAPVQPRSLKNSAFISFLAPARPRSLRNSAFISFLALVRPRSLRNSAFISFLDG
jgi:hypothetical protein